MRILIKFGGSSLANPELVTKMAAKIKSLSSGNRVAVVVSAMGNTTSELAKILKGVGKKDSSIWEVSDVVGMGEVISARVLAMALRKIGIKGVAITPDMESWPVYANLTGNEKIDENKVNQEPLAVINQTKTSSMCKRKILPLMSKNNVPIICGFLAKDNKKRTIAIGRGGSDISAVALGRCLDANRIIIATDVPGILSADPRFIPTKKSIKKISVSEVESLSRGGARVIHPGALEYKGANQRMFIVDCKSKNYLAGGTEIVGKKEAKIFKTNEKLSCITIVGKDFIKQAGLLNQITEKLNRFRISIYNVSVSENYIGIYVKEDIAKKSYKKIYEIVKKEPKFSAVSLKNGIGRLRLNSNAFIEQPGIIGRIGDQMAMKGINILEMETIQSDITIFLDVNDLNKAYSLLKKFSF